MRVQATARACPQTLEGGNGRALKINERALGASASHDYMPKYKHAPIEEAMCEFMFAPSKMAGQWDLTLPGRVQQHPHLRVIHNGVSRQQHVQQIVAEQAAPNTVANIALAGRPRVEMDAGEHAPHRPTSEFDSRNVEGQNARALLDDLTLIDRQAGLRPPRECEDSAVSGVQLYRVSREVRDLVMAERNDRPLVAGNWVHWSRAGS